jgi:hypothetical protein
MGELMPFFGPRGFGPENFFRFEQPETPEVPQANL